MPAKFPWPRWFPVGTRSLLFGVHAFWLHPFYVAWAWWKLYGFPWSPRLWLCFLVHDWGYWGSIDMDGWDGKQHPATGADIARAFCGDEYGDLVLLHSRHYAKLMGRPPSKLCAPDKLASALYPEWLWLHLATLSGEIHEYHDAGNNGVLSQRTGLPTRTRREFFRALRAYLIAEARRTSHVG